MTWQEEEIYRRTKKYIESPRPSDEVFRKFLHSTTDQERIRLIKIYEYLKIREYRGQ